MEVHALFVAIIFHQTEPLPFSFLTFKVPFNTLGVLMQNVSTNLLISPLIQSGVQHAGPNTFPI
jgi:hypothetical protein